MKRTFTLIKNFRNYLLLTGLGCFSYVVNAQVSYTDVSPDETISQITNGETSYEIDLNGDETGDLSIMIVRSQTSSQGLDFTSYSITLNGMNDGFEVAAAPNGELSEAIAFDASQTISSSSTWNTVGVLHMVSKVNDASTVFSTGNFVSSTGKYLGVRFINGENTHYGYIGINTTYNSFTITGFAYNKTSGATIIAGAGETTNISSYVKLNTTIKSINNTIVAEFKNQFNGKLEVVNMNGQVIKSTTVYGLTSSVSMEGAPSGIYQVVVSGAEGFATEKVFIAAR